MAASCWKNTKLQIFLSILGFIVTIGVYEWLRVATFKWSVTTIVTIEENNGIWLERFCKFVKIFGAQIPNVIVIFVFTAMFKRRH